ncbi:MAG: hypothetical protein Q7N50_10780 [Armatimonadota bacterium]|nr:hypothetical protein [Armatimonadota bacterium]
MSTNDVPGANPSNCDVLAMGSWAEHADGSLILVENTESGRVIYSIFDMAKEPPIEYRDAMPEVSFKTTFSWDPNGKKTLNEKWTWHDKTPFPWNRIIQIGVKDGARLPSAQHTLNAAERVMESRERHSTAAERVARGLKIQGEELDRDNIDHRADQIMRRVEKMWDRLVSAVSKLPPDDKPRTKRASKR